jgi:4-cresol dehydrogenase (hydroxylating)
MPSTYWARSFIFIFGFPVTDDPKENAKMRGYFREMVKIGAQHGWGEYRTIPAMYDDVVGTYAFNNHALGRFHDALKDAIDPNGIISAGRYGIWPKHLRKTRA